MKKAFAKFIGAAAKSHPISLFGPENIRPQTDYNPVVPGSDKPDRIDTRPKSVAQREKEVRSSLVWPMVLVAGVVFVFVLAYLIKKF